MTSQLRRLAGLALIAVVLIVLGVGVESSAETLSTQEGIGMALRGSGLLILVLSLIIGGVLLIRGERKPQDR